VPVASLSARLRTPKKINWRRQFDRRNRTRCRTKMYGPVRLTDNVLHERAPGCRKRKLWSPTRRDGGG
jgi:hypothetical protein